MNSKILPKNYNIDSTCFIDYKLFPTYQVQRKLEIEKKINYYSYLLQIRLVEENIEYELTLGILKH